MVSIAQRLESKKDLFITSQHKDENRIKQAVFPMFQEFAQILDERESARQSTALSGLKTRLHQHRRKHHTDDYEQALEGLHRFVNKEHGISIKEPSEMMSWLQSSSLDENNQLVKALEILHLTVPNLKSSKLKESLVELLTKRTFPIIKFNSFLKDLYSKLDLDEAEPLTVDCPRMKQYTNPPPRNRNIYPSSYHSRLSHPENIALLDQAFTFLNELKAKSLMIETLASEASEV